MDSQLIHGDCYQVLPTLPAGRIQTVFIDPPYNIGVDYGDGPQRDRLSAREYLERMAFLIQACVRLLKPTGGLWFLCPERWADQIGAMLSAQLPRRNRIIWRETFGQYREDRFPNGHRHLFWHVVNLARFTFEPDDIRITSQRMAAGDKRAKGPRVPDDVWEFPRLVGNAHQRIRDHPCQLSEALLERVIRCSTRNGDVVLDPMAGTGTTLRVAQRLGRRYVGIEQQGDFVTLIKERLSRPIQQQFFA